MAENVSGETYKEIDGQLFEIKRQLRQRDGYPFSLKKLRNALQVVVEGTFDTARYILSSRLGTVVGLHPDLLLGIKKEDIERNTILEFGEPLFHNIIVPVQMKDGTYRIVQFNNEDVVFLHFNNFDLDAELDRAIQIPAITRVYHSKDFGYVWRIIIKGERNNESIKFYFNDGRAVFGDHKREVRHSSGKS